MSILRSLFGWRRGSRPADLKDVSLDELWSRCINAQTAHAQEILKRKALEEEVARLRRDLQVSWQSRCNYDIAFEDIDRELAWFIGGTHNAALTVERISRIVREATNHKWCSKTIDQKPTEPVPGQ